MVPRWLQTVLSPFLSLSQEGTRLSFIHVKPELLAVILFNHCQVVVIEFSRLMGGLTIIPVSTRLDPNDIPGSSFFLCEVTMEN